MFSSSTLGVLLGTTLLLCSIPDATSYTKYGRTCKDIGCLRDEVCVMVEDPCSIYQRDNCGHYPTCKKSHPGEASCVSTVCGENEYCKTENGVPKCVKKSTAIGYESAGVSVVNGHRVNIDDRRDKTTSNSASNSDPYANANAPPAPADPGYHQVNSGNNLGYPPYPSNSGSNRGSNSGSNSGYPPYPSNGGLNNGYPSHSSSNQGNRPQESGYPPYPTQNRMPMPGYPGQSNYPGYPGQSNYPGYSGQSNHPPYPGQSNYPAAGYPQQYPGQQNYPYGNYPNQNRMHHNSVYTGYRRNGSTVELPSFMIISLASFIVLLTNKLGLCVF